MRARRVLRWVALAFVFECLARLFRFTESNDTLFVAEGPADYDYGSSANKDSGLRHGPSNLCLVAKKFCCGSASACLADDYPKEVAGRGKRRMDAQVQMVVPRSVGGRHCWPRALHILSGKA